MRLRHLCITGLLLFPCLTGLLGCGVTPPVAAPSSFNNWQIQTGTTITPPYVGSSHLYGALQIAGGSQVSGTLNSTVPCTPAVDSVTGTYNSSTGSMSLSTTYTQAMLTLPANTGSLATGTLSGGGNLCLVLMGPTPSVGVQIAPLSGSFVGTVTETASNLGAPITSGSVTAVLTQTSSPTATGLFPLSGTLTFTGKSCTITIPVTGTIGGIGVAFSGPATKPGASTVDVASYTNPTATQITATSIVFSPAPCSTSNSSSTTYKGTLVL